MKKKIISAMLILVMVFSVTTAGSFAATSNKTSVNAKSVCYTPSSDYKSGDCILTATKVMIRRALVARGSTKWSTISNKTLRSSATIRGLLLHRFTFQADGLAFKVSVGFFSGNTEAARIKQFKALIKAHPEGVVVWGKDSSIFGMHGVLLTDVKGNVPYVMDSYYNMGPRKYGIQRWKDSSMKNPVNCTQYWIIKEVGLGKKATAPKKGQPLAPASAKNVEKKSTLTIKDQTKPSKVCVGDGFGVEGVISSNYKLSQVKVQVINSSGKTVLGQTVKPKTWNYDLIKIDSKIKFGTLPLGTYTYKITAKDEKQTKVLTKEEFKVVPQPKSKLKISDAIFPEKVYQGNGFSIGGKISSNCKISKVTVSIVNSSGNTVQSATAKPSAKSYKVEKLDSDVKFGGLAVGTYTYKIVAKDTKQTKTLLKKSFKIIRRPASTLRIGSYNYPGTIKKGSSFSIQGTVNSDKNIVKVTVKVIDSNGNTVLSASGKPNAKSYSIKNLDLLIKFGTLSRGNYTYKVTAQDTAQSLTLLSRKFSVE